MNGPFVQLTGRVVRCVISTAERGSSLNADALDDAVAVLHDLDRTAPGDVGAVLLVGEGNNFCTGGDVGAFAAAADPGRFVGELAGRFHRFQRALIAAPVPVVAAVHGWAAGAGMSIVLAADVVVAGRSARLRPAYPAIGFSPDGGMSWMLPRIVGAARARHILFTDEILPAQTALELGLVSVVVADEEVATAGERAAQRLAAGPTAALGRIKQLLREGLDRDLDSHLDAEARAIAASADDAEGRQGVAAFLARRAPTFRP